MAVNIKEYTRHLGKSVFYFFAGIPLLIVIIIYTLVSLPVFAYRWTITKVAAPIRGGNLRKALTASGSAMCADFLYPDNPPRCSLVVNTALKGNLDFDEFCTLIRDNWILAKNESGDLIYPEFQQYLEPWIGFMFWKQTEHFRLKNHVHHHQLQNSSSDSESETFLCQLIEDLLNKPYPPKTSPWEVHLIQNYKNSALLTERGYDRNDVMYVVVLKIHHTMADGFAILDLLVQQLFGKDLQAAKIAAPSRSTKPANVFARLWSSMVFPLKVIQEGGRVMILANTPYSPFHVQDSEKSWRQLYGRAEPIPLSQVKEIKNIFGVSFASVFNSIIAAALSKAWVKLDKSKDLPKTFLFGNALPTASHSKKLRNQALGVAFNIPIGNMDSLTRLQLSEKYIRESRHSPMPVLSGLALKLFGGNLAVVTQALVRNRYLGSAGSNFPGPGVKISDRNDNPALTVDFTAGALNGVGGIGFMALSYANYIQICASAENAVLSRQQLDELLADLNKEVDHLYNLAMEASGEDVNSLGEEIV